MLTRGDLKKTEVHDVSELARFAEYSQRFGRGERACFQKHTIGGAESS
jgi:hypothetical protein